MAKETGLAAKAIVGGRDISGAVAALNTIEGRKTSLDITAIDKSAMERIQGQADGEMALAVWFDDATDEIHDAFKALPTADVLFTYLQGQVLGNAAAAIVAKQINYAWTRGADGGLAGTVQALANAFGLDWGVQLTTGVQTFTGAANTTGVRGKKTGSSTTHGLQAYIFCTAFTGTSVTATIQESSDDGVGDAYAGVTGGAFAAISAVGAERIATSKTQTVEEYLRVALTGTFNPADLTIIVNVNQAAPTY